jgi:methionine biosynthesis protein MetW
MAPTRNSKEATKEAVTGLTSQPVDPLRYNSKGMTQFEAAYWAMSFIKPGTRVLDIGCGTGSVTETIKHQKNVDIVGLEPNPERAQAARGRGFEVINGVYTRDVPDQHGKFDYILFLDVLEHLADPAAMLTDVAGALNEGGCIIASIPNVAHWTVRLDLLFGKFDYVPMGIMDATHLRWFTRKSVIRLFEASGYHVEQIRGTAGSWMKQYRRTPLRLIPGRYRGRVLNRLGRIWYGLFACQHILLARRTD